MRLAVRSIRETRTGALVGAAVLSLLILLLVGTSPAGLAADYNGTITPNGPSVTVTLSTAGDSGYLTFDGTQGQRVSVVPTSVTIGTSSCCSGFVSIRKPDGSNLTAPKYFGTGGGFIDTVALTTSGTHTVFIDPIGTATGSAAVNLHEVPADVGGAITIGGPAVPVSLTTPGRTASLSRMQHNAVDRLLQDKLVTIYMYYPPYGPSEREEMGADEAQQIIRSPEKWDEGTLGIAHPRLGLTSEVRDYLYGIWSRLPQ